LTAEHGTVAVAQLRVLAKRIPHKPGYPPDMAVANFSPFTPETGPDRDAALG
jgi:hypothetical protein